MSEKTATNIQKSTLDSLAEAGANGTAVDLEKLPVKLIILCQSKKKLESTGNYLNRRGWETVVLSDIKELFKWIASFKPDFLLLSVNHPSPKLDKLPAVALQSFGLRSVTFGERSDTRTLKMMQTVPSTYKITGSISGPSAHRRLKNILQEIYQPPKTALDSSGGTKDLLGSNLDPNNPASQKEKEEQGVFYFKSEQEKQDEAKAFMIAKGENGDHAGALGSMPLSDLNPLSGSKADSDIDLEALANQFATPGEKTGTVAPISEKKLNEVLKESNQASKEFQFPAFNSAKEKELAASVEPQESNRPMYGSADRHGGEDSLHEEGELYKGKLTLENIIRRSAISAALKKSEKHQEISTATEAFAVPITMSGKRGTIVIAQSGNAKDRVSFELKFLNELGRYLKEAGEGAAMEKPLRLTFDIVEVKTLSGEGIISFKIPNNDGDALVTFVEEDKVEPQTKTGKSGKTEVSIHDIVEDVPVGAPVYLHLPKNDRFYRIVSTTAAMSGGQKKRIMAAKAAIYLDTENVSTYVDNTKRNKSIARVKGSWTKKKAS